MAAQELGEAQHWLVLETLPEGRDSAEVMNVFLIALWLLVPTQTHARHIWGAAPEVVHDLFTHIGDPLYSEITDNQLREAGRLFTALSSLPAWSRLHLCLHLTFQGCTSSSWQPGFLAWASALEGLLTYSEQKRGGGGLLADAFALMTERDHRPRRHARRNFEKVYDIRTAIVHGRASEMQDGEENLDHLRALRTILRATWLAVLSDREAIAAFQGDDRTRAAYLDALRASQPHL